MKKNFLDNKLQKYLPFILIIVTVLFGGLLLFKKGFISLSFLGKKTDVVTVKSSMVDLLFGGQEYKLSYSGMDMANLVNIAKFGKTETWQGAGSIEEGSSKGENVLSLIDRDRQKAISYTDKKLNLAGVDLIKLRVDLRTDPENLETLNLIFGNKDLTSFYRFPMTNLKNGLNYITIPKYRFFLVEGQGEVTSDSKIGKEAISVTEKSSSNWDKIEKVQLELISRPTAKANVEVGWIRAEKEELFIPDWSWVSADEDHFFNLDLDSEGKITLFVQNVGGSVATLRRLGSVKDFTYSAKINTLRKGTMGLFFRGDYKTGYGYYLSVGGLGTSDWLISKYSKEDSQPKSTVISNGQIGNFEFSKDQPFWLKVSVRGNSLSAFFSLDGKDWTKLDSVSDNEFSAGGVGIFVAGLGAGYFDDFYLTK